MKKLGSLIIVVAISLSAFSQNKLSDSKIDLLLVDGNYNKVIDTCKQILVTDSLNAGITYKMGLAYQNLLADDRAFDCFQKTVNLEPDNKIYSFTLAKSLYTRGKLNKSKELLLKLTASDSMNWPYSYFLSSIYMQQNSYNDAIKIYNRFYQQDSLNPVITDKIGFACLKKGDFEKGIKMFDKSLAINPNNLNAIKNAAYLYAGSVSADTALQLLTRGINIDSTDMDLYARRAALNFTIFNFREAAYDYQKLVSSGDSSELNLRRAGISLGNINESAKAIPYLLQAYQRDTSDFEVMSYIARHYEVLKDYKSSEHYSRLLIKGLDPFIYQIGLNHLLLAELLNKDHKYSEAISEYLKSQEFRSDKNILMTVAIIYDDKLKNKTKAIYYYELYLKKMKNSNDKYDTDYSESVEKRLATLKRPKP